MNQFPVAFVVALGMDGFIQAAIYAIQCERRVRVRGGALYKQVLSQLKTTKSKQQIKPNLRTLSKVIITCHCEQQNKYIQILATLD